ncbi:MAG: hypothetical protein BWX54_01132 [Verrucomicrobia bacterium ADurb.Bin018]|nr:MAG: hypothetical protein BWX54_01132 [Verrucomicrobia bacterium ADurb.Bin018]
MGRQYNAKQFIDAIPASAGIITTIAKRVGCSWHTAKKYIEAMPTLRQAYQDECEAILDMAESKLYKAVQDGDLQAVKYILATKGKKRGYTERLELGGADGDPIRVVLDE